MTVYFDNAATTKVSKEAADAVYFAMTECFGNPSSTHTFGREAQKLLSDARRSVASAIGAKPETVYFTSGGTESDNIAVLASAELMKHRGKHVITTAVEHDAVLKSMGELEKQGFEVEYLKPDRDGCIKAEEFENALREDTVLVSIMLVNNETGSVFPVGDIAKILKRKGSQAILHTDAVQGFLELPFTVKQLGADIVSLSAHKVHGPKGVGALCVRDGLRLPARAFGGGQESGLRPGTEAMPLIAGFGAAAKAGFENRDRDIARKQEIRDFLRDELAARIPEALFIGGGAPHILSLSLPGYKSEVLLNWLDSRGIFVSKGSACRKGRRSHVLSAMGISEDIIDGALRLSFSAGNTREEAAYFVDSLLKAKSELYKTLGK